MRISDWSSDVCSSDLKSELYISVDEIVKRLSPDDYEKDEKQRSVTLTEDGTEKMERMLEDAGLLVGSNLYDFENTQVVHHVNQALRANVMFKRDTDYIVKDDKVVIIDEFTGRMMDGGSEERRVGEECVSTWRSG